MVKVWIGGVEHLKSFEQDLLSAEVSGRGLHAANVSLAAAAGVAAGSEKMRPTS